MGASILVTRISRAVRGIGVDRSGATAAEYALLLGIIGGSMALATITLGQSVACSMETSASIIEGDPVTGHQYGHSNPQGLAKGHRPSC